MSTVPMALTADQEIRKDALAKAVVVHTNRTDLVADVEVVLKAAEAYADFVRDGAVPFHMPDGVMVMTTTTEDD